LDRGFFNTGAWSNYCHKRHRKDEYCSEELAFELFYEQSEGSQLKTAGSHKKSFFSRKMKAENNSEH